MAHDLSMQKKRTNGSSPNDPRQLGFKFDGDAEPAPLSELIRGILPARGTGLAGGQSGAGKTFIEIDLAVAVASGGDFFGQPVKAQAAVAYFAAEGAGGFTNRLAAAKIERGIDLETCLPLTWTPFCGNLADKRDCDQLIENLILVDSYFQDKMHISLGLVVIDTMAAAFHIKDENNNAEASAAMRQITRIEAATNTFVCGVHHFGKNKESGLRGASAWRASPDIVYGIRADRNDNTGEVTNRTLWLDKNREGEEKLIGAFRLNFHELGIDEDFEPYGSCGVEPTQEIPTVPKGRRECKSAQIFREAFNEALISCPVKHFVSGDGPQVQAVDIKYVRSEFQKRWATGETDKRKRADAIRTAWRRCLSTQFSAYRTENTNERELIWRC